MDTFGLVEWVAALFVLLVVGAPAFLVTMQRAGLWVRTKLRAKAVAERMDVYVYGKQPKSHTPTEAQAQAR